MTSTLKILPASEAPEFWVGVATSEHSCFVDQIIELIAQSAQERGTGRGKRTDEEILGKIDQGKAIISVNPLGELVGFCYVESYEEGKYFATSALVVAHKFRRMGISRVIKIEAFNLGTNLFPDAVPVTITTSAAVIKLNTEMGFQPVTFSEITQDPKFWKGCEGCVNFDVLQKMKRKNCLCTAMKYDASTTKLTIIQ